MNGWYILIIVSDLMTIIGSILKIEIQTKVQRRQSFNRTGTTVFLCLILILTVAQGNLYIHFAFNPLLPAGPDEL